MLKKSLVIMLVCAFTLSGCTSSNTSSSSNASTSTSEPAPSVSSEAAPSSSASTSLSNSISSSVTYVPDASITDPWETIGTFEPKPATTTTIETIKFLEGTDMENDIYVLTAKEEGPTVFICASIHGDEIAGYTAADKLKNMELKKGKLYILSPVNVIGAKRNTRYADGTDDPNRAFPGKADGTITQQLTNGVYNAVKDANPEFVFDLHEARAKATNRDFLGSSLIYTNLDGMEDMFMDLYLATQSRELCSEPFAFFGPGPTGSLNSVITTDLGIPTITVETYRAYQLERRVEDQLAIVGYVLKHKGMVD